ncbi:RDD family protein [Catenovulum sp. 2E275]|uniref:RDD family protein n=1 Tax=Catenovulum sp. 2E275 TaxID=2980497 RepID=UPI0021D0D80F|nr:RDD family protein [Catenovulum sp. 2E275]MCU4675270.1 RDD family protein [Catenovulum sp. 2E275]
MQAKITEDVQVETAEGISIDFQPAGFAARTLAYLFDLILRLAALIAISLIFSAVGEFGIGIILLSSFLLEWFYPILFEHFWGATPGKKLIGLKVIYANGLPLTLPGAMTRNLFRAIDILPFGYLVGLISMMLTGKFQRIGDWVAGTMVVYQGTTNHYSLPKTDVLYQPQFELSTQEQVAVIRFAERTKTLSDSRATELAEILSPVLNSELESRECLKSMANRYIGHR